PQLAGRLDIGRRPVDADDGPDPQLLEGREGFRPMRVPAAVEVRAQAEGVLNPPDFEPLRVLPGFVLRGLAVRSRLLPGHGERDQDGTDEEWAAPVDGPDGHLIPCRHRAALIETKGRLEAVGADDLAAGPRAQGSPGRPRDGALREPDRTVEHQ